MTSSKLFIVFICFLTLSCVKYSFKGALPSYLKTIYIEDFQNQTTYAGVREEFMQDVTQAFTSDNSLQVINNQNDADLILSGDITSIRRQPVSITQTEQVQEFQMVVSIKAECLNTHTQKPLWTSSLQRYGIIPGNALQDDIDRAITEAINQIVEDIITKTVAAW
jgi:outer membrane lipopolysaccharide assembly protein LptE/RlpB